MKGDKIVDVVDVLDLDYHLSYPFIFEEKGDIYMIPEASENNRLEIYKCAKFPDKWELYSTAFEGEGVVDTLLYLDKDMQKWLFINKTSNPSSGFENELFIYKIDSLKLNKIEPHKQNPVIIDSRVARNGGAIFEFEGKTYRPSQRNVDGIYGRALNINQIKELTINDYKEDCIRIVKSDFQKGFTSIHHLHQYRNMFVFDAAYEYL